MQRSRLIVIASLLALLATSLAQVSTSSLRGAALDPNGAAVPGAVIKLENAATGVSERTLTTDASGNYSAEALPPAIYKVSIRKEGFAPETRSIELQVGRVETLDFKLTVGSVEQSITVTGAVPVVDRENSEIGDVEDVKAVGSLPLNGRQLGDLAALVPGVLPAPNFDPIKTRIFNVSAGAPMAGVPTSPWMVPKTRTL